MPIPIDYESYSVARSRERRMTKEQRREDNRQLTAMAICIIGITIAVALLQAAFS